MTLTRLLNGSSAVAPPKHSSHLFQPESLRAGWSAARSLRLLLACTMLFFALPHPPAAEASKRLRVKARTAVGAASAGAAAVAIPASGPAPAGGMLGDLFMRINADRLANGLLAVRWDDRLGALAANWTSDMAVNGFRHRNLNTLGIGTGQYADLRLITENIARGSLVDGGTLHDLLMRSPGHRANTLDGDVDVVGIGALCSGGDLWVAVNFGGDGRAGVPDNGNGTARATGPSGGFGC